MHKLDSIIKAISSKSGVYRFYDIQDQLLYVGKAKNLYKRVSSYFNKIHDSARLRIMVNKIHRISTLEVANEHEALLLENNLIKTLKPRYNVNLRDDKTYPWLVITEEAFPRIFPVRRKNIKGNYFGPYASVKNMYTLLDFFNAHFPLRNCKLDLSPAALNKSQHRPCIEYHIGRCKAPCAKLQTESDYLEGVLAIKKILQGQTRQVLKTLQDKMKRSAAAYAFENAHVIKSQIQALSDYEKRSVVLRSFVKNVEVYHYAEDETGMMVQFFYIHEGAIIQAQHLYLERKLNELTQELFLMGIVEFRNRFVNPSVKQIWVPEKPRTQLPQIKWHVPQKGENLKVLQLCYQNAKKHLMERSLHAKTTHTDVLRQMQRLLHLKNIPLRMEAFDNSHLQGSYTVSAMPVFINGTPEPSEYRLFNIKHAGPSDDYAAMREAVFRRYSRLVKEKRPLPDLIVIDGGKGQLQAACESLNRLNLLNTIDVIGLAKRLEEIFLPAAASPVYLNRRDPVLKTLQHIRDEAHRFGLQHHRKRRSAAQNTSRLETIKGIGPKSSDRLLKTFGSYAAMIKAGYTSWVAVVGKPKAELIKAHLRQEPAE